MNRRLFMSLLGGAVAGLALDQSIPLGRVWSFPKEIVIAESLSIGDVFSIAGVNAVNFQIGDIVTLDGHPERMVVTQVVENRIHLWSPSKGNHGVVGASLIKPLLVGDYISAYGLPEAFHG